MGIERYTLRVDTDQQRGTGCVIGRKLVVTALHVIFKDYKKNAAPTVAPSIRAGGHEAELIWPELRSVPQSPDIALLQWKSYQRFQVAATSNRWEAGADFESYGYPASLSAGGKSYRGKLSRHQENPDLERLDCDAAYAPKSPDGWRGASGAPVFVRSRVCGVIAEVEQAHGPTTLNVTPISRLIDRDEIRPLFQDTCPFRKLLGSAIESSPKVAQEIAQVLSRADPDEQVDALLASSEPLRLLQSLEGLHAALTRRFKRSSRDPETREVCSALHNIACLVVAYYSPRTEADDRGIRIVETISRTGVAFASASDRGLAVQIEPPSGPMDRPAGLGAVGSDVDFGPNALALDAQVLSQLGSKLKIPDAAPGDIETMLRFLEEYAFDLTMPQPYLEISLAQAEKSHVQAALASLRSGIPSLPIYSLKHASNSYELIVAPILNRIILAQRDLHTS